MVDGDDIIDFIAENNSIFFGAHYLSSVAKAYGETDIGMIHRIACIETFCATFTAYRGIAGVVISPFRFAISDIVN